MCVAAVTGDGVDSGTDEARPATRRGPWKEVLGFAALSERSAIKAASKMQPHRQLAALRVGHLVGAQFAGQCVVDNGCWRPYRCTRSSGPTTAKRDVEQIRQSHEKEPQRQNGGFDSCSHRCGGGVLCASKCDTTTLPSSA